MHLVYGRYRYRNCKSIQKRIYSNGINKISGWTMRIKANRIEWNAKAHVIRDVAQQIKIVYDKHKKYDITRMGCASMCLRLFAGCRTQRINIFNNRSRWRTEDDTREKKRQHFNKQFCVTILKFIILNYNSDMAASRF